MRKKILITEIGTGQRLDKFTAASYPDYSRAYLQKQIKNGAVFVNGKIKKPSYILKENDKIEAKIFNRRVS